MIDNEDYLNNEEFGNDQQPESLSLDEQEQRNSNDLVQQIEDENSAEFDETDEVLNDVPGREEGVSEFLERSIPNDNPSPLSEKDVPLTKNLLGDNPPGAEQAAFDAGLHGDAGAEQAKFIADNVKENFRENLDKTSSEIELDKKLKENQ